jgi:para-nitrobenzyl esterase
VLTATVKLASGHIQGNERDQNGVLAFKGIPFAAPPLGALRWRAPADVVSWLDVRDATQFGSPCFAAQLPGLGWLSRGQSEDCLTLNVWTAAQLADEQRPVMVWIHGGGFEFGSSSLPGTDGTRLAAKGIILVSFNYRLGVFGFLAHPELDREGSASGNFGIQDQIHALQWVKENIGAFGGDPNNVTIFGESAGAHSVGLLMASPPARGLFHKAIGQSGAYWDSEHGSISTRDEAHARGRKLLSHLRMGTVAELRTLPANELHKKTAWNFLLDPGATAFAPNIDGVVIPDAPGAIFERGQQADIPLLAGWNQEEHTFFMARAHPAKSAKALRAAAAQQFGVDRVADFTAVYPANSKADAARVAKQLIGDLVISQQTWAWLCAHRATGHSPIFAYYFAYSSPYSPAAAHTAEIPFVFGAIDRPHPMGRGAPASIEDIELSQRMLHYWVNFARAGDPNGTGLPHWPVYGGAGSRVMRFGATSQATAEEQTDKFRFIESFRTDGVFPQNWRSVRGRLPASLAGPLSKTILFVKSIQASFRAKR